MLHCLSKSQVDDIVRRTRIESPPGFDPEELKRDLEAAWDLRTGYADETSKSELTKLRKYADQVSKAATRLVDLLEEFDPSARRMRSSLASSLNVDDVSLTKLHDDLGRLRDRAELLAQRQASMRDVIRLHPNEYFVIQLVRIFERHFQMKATRNRVKDGPLDGPFMRFATAVCPSFGLIVVDETISKAMTAAAGCEF
jgi:hypothetical protein